MNGWMWFYSLCCCSNLMTKYLFIKSRAWFARKPWENGALTPVNTIRWPSWRCINTWWDTRRFRSSISHFFLKCHDSGSGHLTLIITQRAYICADEDIVWVKTSLTCLQDAWTGREQSDDVSRPEEWQSLGPVKYRKKTQIRRFVRKIKHFFKIIFCFLYQDITVIVKVS